MKYGLIGERLPHSFSKEIHALCAPYDYELCELGPAAVDGFMRAAEFEAINVTIPYKRTVIPYLDEIDPRAEAIGAVNTVVNRGGRLCGYNTDFYGLLALIRRENIEISGKKVMILGTGGTSHTAHAVAEALGAAKILTVSRTPKKEGEISYFEAENAHADAEIIINTTPVGMFPHPEATPINIEYFPHLCGVIDAIYNPLRTELVMSARERGIAAAGGLYMLVAQGVLASRVFLGDDIELAMCDTATAELCESVYKKILSDKENIVLTGMPSSGKSTVGRALSKKLGRELFDLDAEIVRAANMPITGIFEKFGEEHFRELESDVIRQIAGEKTGAVIATGGGAILRPENVRALKKSGRIYFIDRAPEHLMPTADRPTASDREAILRRYRERYEIYCSTADQRVATDECIENTVKTIIEEHKK